MGPLAEMARKNMEMWAKMQASMLAAFTPSRPGSQAPGTPPPPRAPPPKPEPGKRRG
jgi:hypothetical protein